MTIAILKTEPFQPLGPAIPKPAPAAPQSREIKPGIWQAPDGKLRTDFATGQSVAPAQKAAPATPLPVVPNALGDWIDMHDGMPDAQAGAYQWRLKTIMRAESPQHTSLRELFEKHEFPFYQYRLIP
jgi:hypothetical protein